MLVGFIGNATAAALPVEALMMIGTTERPSTSLLALLAARLRPSTASTRDIASQRLLLPGEEEARKFHGAFAKQKQWVRTRFSER